ncbi:MAG: hypothetical protein ACE5EX_07205 [Phycisphaerae bacterium]
MRSRSRRIPLVLSIVLGGSVLFSGPGTGCVDIMTESFLTTTDFCFIFDCQNGLFGGTIDPCAGTGQGDRSGELPLFTDCPDFVAP